MSGRQLSVLDPEWHERNAKLLREAIAERRRGMAAAYLAHHAQPQPKPQSPPKTQSRPKPPVAPPKRKRAPSKEDFDCLIAAIFGPKRRPRSLAEALRKGLVPPKFMAEARRIVDEMPYPRRPKAALPARGLPYNDPGWDNVVRALEEDR